MGLLIALAAGLVGFLFSFRPGGERAPRRWGRLALAIVVYLAVLLAAFLAMFVVAVPDPALSAYVVASLATLCAVLGAFAAGRRGAERWPLLGWLVPLGVVVVAAIAGR